MTLSQPVKDALANGDISAGHARALMQTDKPDELIYEVVRRGLNVRQTENLAKAGGLPVVASSKPASRANPTNGQEAADSVSNALLVAEKDKDPDILAIEETLQEYLGMKVLINDRDEKGNVIIFYETLSQLDSILKRIGGAA